MTDRKGKNRKWMAGLLAVVTLLTGVGWPSHQVRAGDGDDAQNSIASEASEAGSKTGSKTDDETGSKTDDETGSETDNETGSETDGETARVTGISLNRTSLVMKTGNQKTLTATILTEAVAEAAGTAVTPDIVWTSDDTSVVTVEGKGLEAVVTAPEGLGGTATITATVGSFSATCRVLVTVQDPMLESVLFMQNSSGSNRYELTEGTPGSKEYTLRVPETTNVVYVRPQLRDDLTESAVISASFTDAYTGEEVTLTLPVDETTSLTNKTTGRIIKAYDTSPKELTIRVSDGEQTETYQIHIVRGSYLGSLSLTDDKGEAVTYSPAFVKTTYAYSAHVPSSTTSLQLKLSAAEETNTQLKVNGKLVTDGTYTLSLADSLKDGKDQDQSQGQNQSQDQDQDQSQSQGQDQDQGQRQFSLVLTAGDGISSPYEYKLTVYVDEVCSLRVKLTPEDAVFAIYDEDNQQLDPQNGSYELIKGSTYTYTISAQGYQTQTGSLTPQGDQELTFALEKSKSSQLEELEAEWGGYWKNQDNQNVVSSPTPTSLSNAVVLWKQKYGENANNNKSVSDGILVEDYLCCFSGDSLMYLDKNTGELVKSVTMTDKGNSSFNKPLYAAGMIFVPLNNGKLQAFNARTLESLWIYVDTVGGSAAAALRYDSGYLYVGFADGNLVCLSVADEDPEDTQEEKAAVWRKYDSGGFYRSGVYTGDKYLYACGRSGSIYCLDKKTGETIQKLSLPSEQGSPSTAVSYADGRIYFATDEGYLCSYGIGEDGRLDETGATSIKLGGTIYGTPLVYQGRIYLGTASKDAYDVVLAPYYLNVVEVDAQGGLSLAYRMEIQYCPKGTGTLTTAYVAQDGYVYVYFTTDSNNGSMYLLKDKAGLTQPGEGSGLFYQQTEVSGTGSGSVLADSQGCLYIRYESAWLYALTPTAMYLEGVETDGANVVVDDGQTFDRQAENHTIVLDPPESHQVTLTFQASQDALVTVNGRQGNVQQVTLVDDQAELQVELSLGDQKRTYHFLVRQRSSDATLEDIDVSYSPVMTVMAMELEPAFRPEITSYNSSLYGSGSMQSYYIWPKLAEDSKASMTLTVVSGVSGAAAGTSVIPMTIQMGEEERQRYEVYPSGPGAAVVDITVTAEDGKTQKVYRLSLFRNNDLPKLTISSDPVISRQADKVEITFTSNMAGYLYYLAEDEGESSDMPTASQIRKEGQRIAIEAGKNTVTLEGFTKAKSILYLYEMSYAQRFTSGCQVEIPVWSGEEEPDPTPSPTVTPDPSPTVTPTPGPTPSGTSPGDLNGDGKITNADAALLLRSVTEGQSLSLELADLNGDRQLTNADVALLLKRVTGGSS